MRNSGGKGETFERRGERRFAALLVNAMLLLAALLSPV
jgi:hypothetical protein